MTLAWPIYLCVLFALLGFGGLSAQMLRKASFAQLGTRIRSRIRNGFERGAECLPDLIWREDEGKLVWANRAFRDKMSALGYDTPNLSSFQIVPCENNETTATDIGSTPIRAVLMDKINATKHPFNLQTLTFKNHRYFRATSAAEAARAEMGRQKLVQNISQTFIYAPVGIVFFDAGGSLTMFNPRVSELLNLSPAWLAGQPSLKEFLHRLHDKGTLPEPPDFNAWCKPFENACMPNKSNHGIVLDAEIGQEIGQNNDPFQPEKILYEEDWNMPNGQIYHVRAHAHPNQALSFYIEDITNHITVEREYRADLKSLYRVFDALQSAIVIFDRTGAVAFSNQTFDTMWGEVFSSGIPLRTIDSLMATWTDHCQRTGVFKTLRDFVLQAGVREVWVTDIITKTGQDLGLRAVPLGNGQTVCEFYLQDKSIGHHPSRISESPFLTAEA